jgi:hypothetical protein
MSKRESSRWIVVIVAVSLTFPGWGQAIPPEFIDRTISLAKTWIYKEQKGDNWEKPIEMHGDQKTGQTALAVYALLTAGESRQDPHIVSAVEYLRKTDTTGVYALGVRCQVWLMLPQTPQNRASMVKDANILLNSIKKTGEGKGFYDYNPGTRKAYSHSRAQYAVLGMWAAAQAGIEVPTAYWQLVEKSWIEDQDPSGGWGYLSKPNDQYPLTAGMTAVGIATLFITQDYLHADDGAACRGNIRNPNIDKGIKWIVDNFSKVATNEKSPRDFPYSTAYAVERIGVASGYKLLGNIDWYEKGANWLMKNQQSNGSWPAEISGDKLASTCLATLFLARGRLPVAINKLDYTVDADKQPNWNQRPRDVANLSRWIGRQSESELNWQIVSFNGDLDDLHDAPVLYLAGNEPLKLRDADKAKLKQFVQEGGLIFGNADCANKAFADSFRKLGGELFADYEFRELPDQHPIYTNEQYTRAKWKSKPSVLSLGNEVRELMILIPQADMAKWWQLQVVGGKDEAWQLPADVFFYAVDKHNLRFRGETYTIARNNSTKATRSLKLARIKCAGNWDPEPAGWKRMSNLLHNKNKLDVEVTPITPGSDKLDAKLAHLTGTARFKFDESQRNALKAFVDGGGVLVVDAAGGSTAFAQSAESELASMFTEPLKQLPPEHPVFTAGGLKAPPIKYREYAQKVLGSLKDVPRLQGIERNGRVVVFYSKEDLTAGLVGQPVDGIVGYTPATATDLMQRIVLYAESSKPHPASAQSSTAPH